MTGKHFDDAIPTGRITVRLCTLDTTNQTVIIALEYIKKNLQPYNIIRDVEAFLKHILCSTKFSSFFDTPSIERLQQLQDQRLAI